MDPTAEPVELPEGYGTATTTMEWAAVRERLEQAPRYWLVTNRRDGRAHVVPVDGIWLDEAWWYGGSPGTLHQRNLEHDRRVVVHLEDTMAAVILEGSMERVVPAGRADEPPQGGLEVQVRLRPARGGLRRRAVGAAPATGEGLERLPHRRHPLPLRLAGTLGGPASGQVAGGLGRGTTDPMASNPAAARSRRAARSSPFGACSPGPRFRPSWSWPQASSQGMARRSAASTARAHDRTAGRRRPSRACRAQRQSRARGRAHGEGAAVAVGAGAGRRPPWPAAGPGRRPAARSRSSRARQASGMPAWASMV